MFGAKYVRFLFSTRSAGLELDNLEDTRPQYTTSAARDPLSPEHETQPLISSHPDPTPNDLAAKLKAPNQWTSIVFAPRSQEHQIRGYIAAAMEKLKNSGLANQIAVDSSEPGLTNAQLMLCNFDLKPGQ